MRSFYERARTWAETVELKYAPPSLAEIADKITGSYETQLKIRQTSKPFELTLTQLELRYGLSPDRFPPYQEVSIELRILLETRLGLFTDEAKTRLQFSLRPACPICQRGGFGCGCDQLTDVWQVVYNC
jgi:hypothetical protein